MGSAFAAVKAGILGGIFYAGSIGIFNLFLLQIFKENVKGVLSRIGCSGTISGGPAPTPEDCFASIIVVYLPLIVFMIFVLALVFAGSFGAFFEYIPGASYRVKALAISLILFVVLLLLNLTGVSFDYNSNILVAAFDFAATFIFAMIIASFYKRYTRVVEFNSQDPDFLRIIVDRRDVTGKIRTMAASSAHTVRASVLESASFKEWSFSGGVTLEDPKSFETVMRVGGDGMVKASFTITRVT